MKKHTKLLFLFGIVLSSSSLQIVGKDDNFDPNGPYSPGKIIPMIIGVTTNILTNISFNILSQSFMTYIKQTISSPEILEKYKTEMIPYHQLKTDDNLSILSTSFYPDFKNIVTQNKNEKNKTQTKHIHLYQTSQEDAEILAQAIAYESQSNFYKIHKDKLNPQVDLNKLTKEFQKISRSMSPHQQAIVYMEFDQFELEKNIYSKPMIDTHNLYNGTLAQGLSELLKKYPHVTIITGAHHQKTTSTEETNILDIRYAPTQLQNIIMINPPKHKKTMPQSKDFTIVEPTFIKNEVTSACIALNLTKQNNKHPLQTHSWWESKPPHVVYKPTENTYTENYFKDITEEISDAKLNQAVHDACNTKLHHIQSKQPKTLTERIFSSILLQPKPNNQISQIDILAEIADQKIDTKYKREFSYSPTKEYEKLFNTLPETPTKQVIISSKK